MVDHDPVAVYLKSDPDLYCGIRSSAERLTINDIGHVKGHQNRSGRELSNIEKLNILADNLATKAVIEENTAEPEWHESFGPMLKIQGKVMTQKEGMKLGVAASIDKLHEWQMNN